MYDLWKILNENGYAKPNVTLGSIWVNTYQDAQYSPEAHEHIKVLEKYKEFFNLTVEQMRSRFLMKDINFLQ
jgi:hypothetical protein